jgi:hypothetical protein
MATIEEYNQSGGVTLREAALIFWRDEELDSREDKKGNGQYRLPFYL